LFPGYFQLSRQVSHDNLSHITALVTISQFAWFMVDSKNTKLFVKLIGHAMAEKCHAIHFE